MYSNRLRIAVVPITVAVCAPELLATQPTALLLVALLSRRAITATLLAMLILRANYCQQYCYHYFFNSAVVALQRPATVPVQYYCSLQKYQQ